MTASLYASARAWRSTCRDVVRVARNIGTVADGARDADLEPEDVAAA